MPNSIKILQNIDFDDDEDDYNDVDDGDGIVTLFFQCISHFSFTSIILIQIQQLWQVYSTYQFFCSTTIFPLSQMNLPIRLSVWRMFFCSSRDSYTSMDYCSFNFTVWKLKLFVSLIWLLLCHYFNLFNY